MEAEVYYNEMDADEIRWSREDDTMGYYPRRNDSDGYTISTPWRVRKIIDDKGYIAGWAVSKKIEITDDEDNVTEVKYEGERYLDKAEEAKRVAEKFICDEVNEQRKAKAEQQAADEAAEVALAEPTVAAIKTWIQDNNDAVVEAGMRIEFENEEVDMDMTAQSMDSYGWRKWSCQGVQFVTATDDGYNPYEVSVSIPHPAGTGYSYDDNPEERYTFSKSELTMRSLDNHDLEQWERRGKAIEFAVAIAKYCDDVNDMVREQEKLTVRS